MSSDMCIASRSPSDSANATATASVRFGRPVAGSVTGAPVNATVAACATSCGDNFTAYSFGVDDAVRTCEPFAFNQIRPPLPFRRGHLRLTVPVLRRQLLRRLTGTPRHPKHPVRRYIRGVHVRRDTHLNLLRPHWTVVA